MKRLLILAAMAATSTAAYADSVSPTVTFEGKRKQVCEVRDYETAINFGELSNLGDAGEKSDTLTLFCNVRYNATLESDNGFLKLDTTVADAQPNSQADHSATGYSGFSAALDYSVATLLGNATTAGIDADAPLALGGLQDPINLTTTITYDTVPESQPLLGGTYEDTLTLTISPVAF
ncbi:MAG: hypothetical protein ABI668_12450 [Sphingorhabdus sp.]